MRWVKLSRAFLRNDLVVLTKQIPVEWKRNFQNELTNQKIKSKLKFNLDEKKTFS